MKKLNLNLNKITTLFSVSVVYVGVGIILVGAVCYFSGIHINTTKSIPSGVYLTVERPVKKGEYVIFCPPKNKVFDMAKERGYISGGFCLGNYSYMMKKILAVKNDTITINTNGVIVNTVLVPFSKLIKADAGGKLLPQLSIQSYVLKTDELLLMSDVNKRSFDGRYFGLVNRNQVKSVIDPIFLW